jgi:hypothetical protein
MHPVRAKTSAANPIGNSLLQELQAMLHEFIDPILGWS